LESRKKSCQIIVDDIWFPSTVCVTYFEALSWL
jgi:hypothetical protein